MAAPVYSTAGAGVVVTSGDLTNTISANNGDLIMLQVEQNNVGAAAPTVLAGTANIADLAGTANAMTFVFAAGTTFGGAAMMYAALGRATATGTITVVTDRASGADNAGRLYAFTGANTGSALSDVIENTTAGSFTSTNGTSTTIADAAVVTTAADRLAVNLVYVNDDNALGAFTGQTGGTWVERAVFSSTVGNPDVALQLQTANMAASGTVDGGTFVMSASDAWGVLGFALKPAESAAQNVLAWTVA